MDKRQDYLQKIDAIPTIALNREQKATAKKIIENTEEKDLNEVFGLITQRVKTGFVFDAAPEVNHNAVALAVEKPTLNINVNGLEEIEGKIEHKLIIGENYDALKNLCATYIDKNGRGMIDVIYIDPPYNTEATKNDGNDYKEEVEATKFVYRDKFTRDGWLNMMNERLKLAKRLLSDKGVIFISIDDSEQAYLKVLCDEIFGESNFVTTFDWRKKTGANDAKDIAVITENILLYTKNRKICFENNIWQRDNDSIDQNRYRFEDEFVDIRGKFYYDTLDRGGLQYSDSMNFGIEAPDGGLIFPNGRSTFVNDGWIWKWSKDKVEWGLKHGFLEFVKSTKSSGSSYTIKYKVYQNVDNEGNPRIKAGRAYTNLILEPINQQGNAEMKALFCGATPFSNPKPIGLIKYLLNTINCNNAILLDFFAGSGTTGQAVMELNEEDGGKRQFILVTNNENGIGENITHERLYRVINGQGSKGETIAWKYSEDTPCLVNNSVRVFGTQTEELTLQDLDKAEQLKVQAQQEFKKLNSQYDNTNEFDIYNELAALNPIKKEESNS